MAIVKPKILYLITQATPFGGAQKYVLELAAAMAEEFEVTVAAGGNFDKSQIINPKAKVEFKVIKSLVREISPWKDLVCLWWLFWFMRREKFAIVHTNSSKAEVLGNLAARLAGVPKIVFTAHGFVFNEPLSPRRKKSYFILEKLAARCAHKIICVSEFDRRSAMEHELCAPEKLITVHNGLPDVENGKGAPDIASVSRGERPTDLPDAAIMVGVIANFYPVKGLRYLLRAAAEVKKSGLDINFAILGDGEERADLERLLEELDLRDTVQLLGFKENAAAYLPHFDIFCLSSLKEGLPYAIIEAMRAGLPVVATRVGGIPELVEDNASGFLVAPRSVAALAEKILVLAQDGELRRRFGTKAREKFLAEYGFEKMLEETRAVYN